MNMTAHCSDKLSYPIQGYLSDIDFGAEIKPCKLKAGVTATHTTTINNQRTGDIHKIEICVRPRYSGVILNGDPSLTEYKHGIPMLRSGKDWSHKFWIERNSTNLIPNDEIATSVSLYDSTQVSGTTYGTPEGAAVTFTVDIS
jgi:hypothetical protein